MFRILRWLLLFCTDCFGFFRVVTVSLLVVTVFVLIVSVFVRVVSVFF